MLTLDFKSVMKTFYLLFIVEETYTHPLTLYQYCITIYDLVGGENEAGGGDMESKH